MTTDDPGFFADYVAGSTALHCLSVDTAGTIVGCTQTAARWIKIPTNTLIGSSLWSLLFDPAELRQILSNGSRHKSVQGLAQESLDLVDTKGSSFALDRVVDLRVDGFVLLDGVPAEKRRGAVDQLERVRVPLLRSHSSGGHDG